MASKNFTLSRLIPIIVLLSGLVCFFHFRLFEYLSFNALKAHQTDLLSWTAQHYFLSVICYMLLYIVAVAISIPGATILTLAGGFLFGVVPGTCYVLISATIGAVLVFLAVNLAVGDVLAKKAGGWVKKMELGFQENAFNYMLALRLVPVFPFWVVNIVPALLKVSLKTYFIASIIGMFPGSLVYVMVGDSLGNVFATNQTPNLAVIFSPGLLLSLLALAALSLLPIVYKRFRTVKE